MSSADAAPAPDPLVRERLARALGPDLELLGLLGRGGFAEVYEVRDNRLHRRLAVKVLRPDLAWTEGMLHRFEEEARSLARLSHPNILPIHFVGDSEGLVYYAMPFVEARSVGQLLREQGLLDPDTAVQLIRPILDALEHAHARGMIHRDIKPDNILVENGTGRPLLVDFGIARQMDGSPGTTGSGFVVGTPTYMSPEQALGQQNVDHRTDLYAVGAMLYQMLIGQPPYRGETSQEVIGRHINDPIPAPYEVREDVPEWLSSVVVHAMAKRPDDRYQHAAEMAADLGEASGVQTVTTSPAKVRRWIRHDDPTAIIPTPGTAVIPAGGGVGRRASDYARAQVRRRATDLSAVRTWRPYQLILWVLFLAALVSAAVFFMTARPTFYLTNRLVLPITVTTQDGTTQMVVPGGEFKQPMGSDGTLLVTWAVERTMNDDFPMGEDLHGTIRLTAPTIAEVLKREVHREIDAWSSGDTRYFAPIITNASGVPVRVQVNYHTSNEGCYCIVPDGETMVLGYFKYMDQNRIRVNQAVPPSRSWVFDNLTSIDPISGAVHLTVLPEHFTATQ